MLKIRYHASFKRDYKKIAKRGYDIKLIEDIIQKLAKEEQLPEKNKDHSLSGVYAGCRECHITPDWLLIYEIDNGELILYLTRTGTHSVQYLWPYLRFAFTFSFFTLATFTLVLFSFCAVSVGAGVSVAKGAALTAAFHTLFHCAMPASVDTSTNVTLLCVPA